MSQNSKLSLWQKLKRLLTSSAPQAIIHAVDSANSSATGDVDNVSTAAGFGYPTYNSTKAKASIKPTTGNNKVSLIKATSDKHSSKDIDVTPIIDHLKNYFNKRQWHYTHYKPRASDPQRSHHLSLRIKSKKVDCGYLFRVQEGNSLLAVYGILPFLIPETHQSAAMLLMTQINYDLLIGNLEMDVNDGEIRYKNAIDIEVVGINNELIEHLLQSVVAMTTVAYEVFGDLLNTQNPSKDMPTLLGELRQQADTRTFFLATQKKQ